MNPVDFGGQVRDPQYNETSKRRVQHGEISHRGILCQFRTDLHVHRLFAIPSPQAKLCLS